MLRAVLAMLGQVPRRGLPRGAETRVPHAVGGQGVLRHAVPLLIDLQVLRVAQYLDVSRLLPGTQ